MLAGFLVPYGVIVGSWKTQSERATLERLRYERPLYAVLELPIFQVSPERSARLTPCAPARSPTW